MLRDEVLLVLLVFLVLLVLLLMLRDEVSAESEMSTSALSSRFRPNQSLSSPPSQANASTKYKNAQEREKAGGKKLWHSFEICNSIDPTPSIDCMF